MDAYKYYTKEQYEKFGSILETAKEIDARLKDNKTQNYNNNKLMKSYKNEWKERKFFKQNNSKNTGIIRKKMVPIYVTSPNF